MLAGSAQRVLLVEDHPGDASLLRAMLEQAGGDAARTVAASRLEEALAELSRQSFDVLLLDLGLPDSSGLSTLERIQHVAQNVPIIVLSGPADLDIALEAVRRGAQDFLRKGSVSPETLMRAIGYAIERHRILKELAADSLIDELTGLYNRRGLITLATPIIRTAVRHTKGLSLLFIDLDGLKPINDILGHDAGNEALVETAHVLRENFRQADVLARLGGDEFVVLAVGAAAADSGLLVDRLQQSVQQRNARPERQFQLSISVGVAPYDVRRHSTLETLMAEADALMYAEKRRKRLAAPGPLATPLDRSSAAICR